LFLGFALFYSFYPEVVYDFIHKFNPYGAQNIT